MGSSPSRSGEVSPHFLARFHAKANVEGILTFADFMALALYDPEVGYYRRAQTRVGYGSGTDFFTASTSAPIFGELVAAACTTLLGAARIREYAFVEIGAEPEHGV